MLVWRTASFLPANEQVAILQSAVRMKIYSNILEMIGRTPLLRTNNMDTGPCELFLKLELMNPDGSVKDRIGLSMIDEAEKRGDLKPGDTIRQIGKIADLDACSVLTGRGPWMGRVNPSSGRQCFHKVHSIASLAIPWFRQRFCALLSLSRDNPQSAQIVAGE